MRNSSRSSLASSIAAAREVVTYASRALGGTKFGEHLRRVSLSATVALDSAAGQRNGSRRQIERFVSCMRAHHDRATLGAQPFECRPEPCQSLPVESRGGLVEQE